jgi:pseudouridine-5'-phosphate glycosidase/pseudouridine kinase
MAPLPLLSLYRTDRLGMPHPKNYETAQSVESIIRAQGITPATIALVGGKIHIGLAESKLAEISDTLFKSVKVSRRDLAAVLSRQDGLGNGGTTVAGTMYIARSVGIPMFVTGGIGGVHRGAESSASLYDRGADERHGRLRGPCRIG